MPGETVIKGFVVEKARIVFIFSALFTCIMKKLKEALIEYGLAEKEAAAYLALLQLGEATAVRLAEVTNINRTTLYDILKALKQKGLAGQARKGAVTFFHASHPDFMLENLKKRTDSLQGIIPSLNALIGAVGRRPTIEFYEGGKGLDAIYQDILRAGKPIFGYGSFEIIEKTAHFRTLDYRKQRILRNIPTSVVTDSSIKRLSLLKEKKYREITTIRIAPSMRRMPSWTYVYGSKVAIVCCEKENLFGFLIDSPVLAAKERQVFDLFANNAELLHKNKLRL